MVIYIRSMAGIAPPAEGPTASAAGPAPSGDRLTAAEPDYPALIDAKQLRRMSRIVKMGVAAAIECLRQAGGPMPGAIVTGTAFGCLEDTGVFLHRMNVQQEEALSPTPFIQSTHNTIGAQIALLLQCTNYNNTFVHRGFSFESALLDAMLLLQEGADNVLAGSVDEITEDSHAILRRFGLYRHAKAGEGAAFFLLTRQASDSNLARLEGLDTLYKPTSTKQVEDWISHFLAARGLRPQDPDLVLLGSNGDPVADRRYDQLAKGIFSAVACTGFKAHCGEYPTASSFALQMATGMIKAMGGARRILIYNHYLDLHHSLILVSHAEE